MKRYLDYLLAAALIISMSACSPEIVGSAFGGAEKPTPVVPDEPQNPETPDEPETPETPDEPENPVEPEVKYVITTTPVSDAEQFVGEAMSPNGLLMAGSNLYAPAVWNTETGEITTFSDNEEGSFHAVNNSGIAVGEGFTGVMGAKYAIVMKDGEVSELYADKGEYMEDEWGGFYTGEAGSAAWAVNEDGSVIAGFYFTADYTTTPCIWKNGERIDLPVPSEEELGFYVSGGEARYMSEDGSVIVGFVIDDMSTWPLMVWRLEGDSYVADSSYTVKYFETPEMYGTEDRPYMWFSPNGLSANGEWVSILAQESYDFNDFDYWPENIAVRLNLVSGEINVIKEDITFYGIADDGTTVGAGTNMMTGQRTPYIWKAGEAAASVLSDCFEFDYLDEQASVTPGWISADGKTIAGWAQSENWDASSFVIKETSEN